MVSEELGENNKAITFKKADLCFYLMSSGKPKLDGSTFQLHNCLLIRSQLSCFLDPWDLSKPSKVNVLLNNKEVIEDHR